jgi:hypothetical protein
MNNHPTITFLPKPRQIEYGAGIYSLVDRRLLIIHGADLPGLLFAARRIQSALCQQKNAAWEIVASEAVPAEHVGMLLRISPEQVSADQGYRLAVSPERIELLANDPAGAFYGACTLVQLIEQCADHLPCLTIQDWPDFPARGVMLDISRDKVPTMETLYALVDLLSSWKVNQLQLYTEHTFKYQCHPEVWAKATPLFAEEVMDLDEYCRQRHVELVPNQNSFGHMERWLMHDRYRHLAEMPDIVINPVAGPSSLCPIDPDSLPLIYSLYDELLPNFSSRTVNVGCDETFDLGKGRSQAACDERGSGRVYLDYLLNIYHYVRSQGRIMQFWGDIILQHPDLISELPKDMIALEWGYEADHPFDDHGAQFARAGLPFYVCPGTSSWNSIAGRSDNAIGNLRNAAENGLKHGAIGYLNTDWGDNGHWQCLPVSYLGFAAGAAYSWAFRANQDIDLPAVLDRYAFRDQASVMGKLACDLGNAYQKTGLIIPNESTLFWILQMPLARLRENPLLGPIDLKPTCELVEAALDQLKHADMQTSDKDLVRQEFILTCRMLRHACWRGRLAKMDPTSGSYQKLRQRLHNNLQKIIAQYRQVWLSRNRPGGLDDSLTRLEKAGMDYQ